MIKERESASGGPFSIPDEYENLGEYFEIEAKKSPILMEHIEDMLGKSSLSEGQFADFVENMIMLAGGKGMRFDNGRELMVFTDLGDKPGDSIELRRYFGERNGPDVYCNVRKVLGGEVTAGSPLVFDEDVALFSYDSSTPPCVTRKIDVMVPSFVPENKSVTGEDIRLFRPVDLEPTIGLSPEQLANIARNIYGFYSEETSHNNSDTSQGFFIRI